MPPTQAGRHWLAFTQMASFAAEERTFVLGEGTSLVDARGRRVFDATSSIWTTIHGHCRPEIADAVARQAATLDHATALGATNPVADELAARLCALTGLDAAFFASDGASAIEAALKMSVQFWQNAGEPRRTRFAHLRDSYHGDTAGAMGVSDIALFRERFAPLLVESLRYDDLAAALERDDLAAIVVEPRVQAAAGMRLVPRERYAPLRPAALARRGERRPLVIADEIATGFGRTGAMFAFPALGLEPDLVCLGKGLTGGALALAATLATRRIYEAFLGAPAEARHFFHGHSYAGNPIACAAALASLEIFERDGTLERVAALDAELDALLAPLRSLPAVRDIRRAGLMIGIEIDEGRIRAADGATPGWTVANGLYDRGHFTRPIGATIQLVPPLVTSPAEIAAFAAALGSTLAALEREPVPAASAGRA